MIACFVADVFFSAKIIETARLLGKEAWFADKPEEVKQQPELVVVDLNNQHIPVAETINRMKERFPATPVIGFLSHLQAELKQQAKIAGCDYVVPRSLFSDKLPEIISGRLFKRPLE